MRRLILCLAILLSACEQPATPFPVDGPTETPAAMATAASAGLRIALAPNIAGTYGSDTPDDARVSFTQLTEPVNLDDLGSSFDMIVAYGAYEDAIPSPTLINYALLINTTLPPLDDPLIAGVVRQALDPASLTADLDVPDIRLPERQGQSAAALQTILANAGWPDGFDLSFGHDADLLALSAIHQQLGAVNITLSDQPLDSGFSNYHLALVTWTTLRERETWTDLLASEDHMLELFGLPISYWAVPGLEVAFGAGGWPVVLLPTPESN